MSQRITRLNIKSRSNRKFRANTRIYRTALCLIAVSLLVIAVTITKVLPYQARLSHARVFADTQVERMRSELANGESPESVLAITQAEITEETSKNADFEFTKYKALIDSKKRLCQVNVEISYGRHYKKFSSKTLKY